MSGLRRTITGFTPGRIQHWIRLAVVVAALVALTARATTFSAALDRDTIVLGDTATLTLKFDDGQPQGTPQLPQIPGLQISYSGPSSSFSFVNGKTSSSVTHTYVVKPTQVGDFVFPALTLSIGNETLKTEAIKFKVVRAATPTPGSETEQQQLALLRSVLPKKEFYVGETFVLELDLLIRNGVQGLGGTDLPGLQSQLQIDGCTAGRAVEGTRRQTTIGATAFTVIPLRIPVTILKPGSLKVGPLDGAVVVELPGRSQRDVFDPFGMFNRGVQQRVAVSAPEVTLTALALPETSKPLSFSGAVGQFKMAVSAGPTNVAVGDPVTIRVQVHGRGSLDAFTLPEQATWKEFKTYPPTVKTETTGDLGLEGTKSFEQVVVPQNAEIKELPAFEFSFFNPETKQYETLRQEPMPIIVRPAGATPSPTLALAGSKPEENKPAQDIVHIKPRLGTVTVNAAPWVQQKWFLAAQSLPALALLGAFLWRRRADTLANNPRLRRQKQVEQVVADGLDELQKLASEGQGDEFFATVFRLMQEQIGERLDLPASAITEAVVDDKLRARGLGDSAIDVLHELFQMCNQARYAPEQSAQRLEAIIPKLKMALKELQEVKS
ncbi:MAG: hypothetical protein RLY20_2199 [Verrucomicrobiota bacterium]|jgi:hypothetical protein